MFYSANKKGEKEFTISRKHLREIKFGLNSVGEKREISVPYWTIPTNDLLRRIKDMGLELTENDKVLGKYIVKKIA